MQHIRKVCIFDFDGTMVDSPLPTAENKQKWATMSAQPLGKGWWGNPNSLCIEVFDPKLIEHVKADALDRIADESCYVVLLTGRMPRFSKVVKEILRQGGIPYMDDYFFNGESDTMTYKLGVMRKLHEQFPHVKEMEMWEDRVEHIPSFISLGEELVGKGFILHQI